ncbi:MAG: hypothetical protein SGILL_002269 [Bacillariaceae sp.]
MVVSRSTLFTSPQGVQDFVQVDSASKEKLALQSPKKKQGKIGKIVSSLNSPKKPKKAPATKDPPVKSPTSPSKKSTKKVSIASDKTWDGKKERKVKVKKTKSAMKGARAPVLSKPQESTQQLLRAAAAMAESSSDDPEAFKIQALKTALEETAQRLKQVTEQQQKDKEEIKEAMKQQKKQVKDKLESLYMPVINAGKADCKSGSKKQAETAELIEYLKKDNQKLRTSIETWARKIKDMKQQNASLERANDQAEKMTEELKEQVEEMEAVQSKLNDNCAVFKAALTKMKKDYKKRTKFHQAETNCSNYFDTCISKIVKNVTDRSKQADLIEDIYTFSAQGSGLATEQREEHSPAADLAALPAPEKKNNKGSWSFMHEEDSNDSDSDDDDDDDEYDSDDEE